MYVRNVARKPRWQDSKRERDTKKHKSSKTIMIQKSLDKEERISSRCLEKHHIKIYKTKTKRNLESRNTTRKAGSINLIIHYTFNMSKLL